MAKFITIGERIHCISPVIRKAMAERDPAPILQRAKEQLDAGATYLDVNIGPAENDGEELMQWAVKLLQENFDNVPLALDTANMKAIEAAQFIESIITGKQVAPSAADAWCAAEVDEAVVASAADGQWHEVPRVEGRTTFDA